MINTCDPDIAGWSEDGETFVVKDPQRFQEQCIPTYFKHAKFSSFVRQLNFYSFRKIKYADTILIDPKLEAETANYWRFRHENFRKGHPELLTEIKRMNGQKNTAKDSSKEKVAPSEKPDKASKSEVQTLKKQIEAMSKNIDELTAMVQKVSVKQDEQEKFAEEKNVGSKRKKLDSSNVATSAPLPDEMLSSIQPDEMLSSMELDEMALPVAMPSPVLSHRETSDATPPISDNEFVDELFDAFTDGELLVLESSPEEPAQVLRQEETNRPDPELMNRLGEALALLPKDIQVLIVDRLIAAITSTDALENSKLISDALSDTEPPKSTAASKVAATAEVSQTPAEGSFPLAAATLAALLRHYSSQVSEKAPKSVQKTIPVIPVHA